MDEAKPSIWIFCGAGFIRLTRLTCLHILRLPERQFLVKEDDSLYHLLRQRPDILRSIKR